MNDFNNLVYHPVRTWTIYQNSMFKNTAMPLSDMVNSLNLYEQILKDKKATQKQIKKIRQKQMIYRSAVSLLDDRIQDEFLQTYYKYYYENILSFKNDNTALLWAELVELRMQEFISSGSIINNMSSLNSHALGAPILGTQTSTKPALKIKDIVPYFKDMQYIHFGFNKLPSPWKDSFIEGCYLKYQPELNEITCSFVCSYPLERSNIIDFSTDNMLDQSIQSFQSAIISINKSTDIGKILALNTRIFDVGFDLDQSLDQIADEILKTNHAPDQNLWKDKLSQAIIYLINSLNMINSTNCFKYQSYPITHYQAFEQKILLTENKSKLSNKQDILLLINNYSY